MEIIAFLQIGLVLAIALAVVLLLAVHSQSQAPSNSDERQRPSAFTVKKQRTSLAYNAQEER